jgi:hypothetical protein
MAKRIKLTDKVVLYFFLVTTLFILGISVFFFWLNIVETEKETTKAVNQDVVWFGNLIKGHEHDSIGQRNQIFMELNVQLKWAWTYEKFNRSQLQAAAYLSFTLQLVIIFITLSLVTSERTETGKLIISKTRLHLLIFFSLLHILFSMFVEKQDFDGQQRIHDRRAKEMSMLRKSLDMNLISNEQAWIEFQKIYQRE